MSDHLEKIKTDEAKKEYLELWDKAGVNVCSATYAGPPSGLKDVDAAFETSVRGIAQARGIIDSLDGELRLVPVSYTHLTLPKILLL